MFGPEHVLLIAALAVACAMGLAAMPAPTVAQRTYPVVIVVDEDEVTHG